MQLKRRKTAWRAVCSGGETHDSSPRSGKASTPRPGALSQIRNPGTFLIRGTPSGTSQASTFSRLRQNHLTRASRRDAFPRGAGKKCSFDSLRR